MEHSTFKHLITKDFRGVTYYWDGVKGWSDDIFQAKLFPTEKKAREERNELFVAGEAMAYTEVHPFEMILRPA